MYTSNLDNPAMLLVQQKDSMKASFEVIGEYKCNILDNANPAQQRALAEAITHIANLMGSAFVPAHLDCESR